MSSIKGLAFLFLAHVSSILMRMNAAHMILKSCMAVTLFITYFNPKALGKKCIVLYKCTNHCDIFFPLYSWVLRI